MICAEKQQHHRRTWHDGGRACSKNQSTGRAGFKLVYLLINDDKPDCTEYKVVFSCPFHKTLQTQFAQFALRRLISFILSDGQPKMHLSGVQPLLISGSLSDVMLTFYHMQLSWSGSHSHSDSHSIFASLNDTVRGDKGGTCSLIGICVFIAIIDFKRRLQFFYHGEKCGVNRQCSEIHGK